MILPHVFFVNARSNSFLGIYKYSGQEFEKTRKLITNIITDHINVSNEVIITKLKCLIANLLDVTNQTKNTLH